MSFNKLLKFLWGPLKHPRGDRILTPVVLADSKGSYLHSEVVTYIEREIVWRFKSGATIKDGRIFLEENIDSLVREFGNISLYVWFGTCTLTSKTKGGCISLSSFSDEIIDSILTEIQKIRDIISRYPDSKLTILEVPLYSIIAWNKKRRNHPDLSQFVVQEQALEEQIVKLNREIRKVNTELHSYSPKFSSDLARTSKYRKGSKHDKSVRRVHHNFQLYKDGIHPIKILAITWLRKINDQIVLDCWPDYWH